MFLVILLLPLRITPNKVAIRLLKAVCKHEELMAKSLLGRSVPKTSATKEKDPFPAIDPKKEAAIFGGSILPSLLFIKIPFQY